MSLEALTHVARLARDRSYTFTYSQHLVLQQIADHHRKGGENWDRGLSYDCLARETKRSRRIVIDAVAAVEAMGVLGVLRAGPGRGRHNHYFFPLLDAQAQLFPPENGGPQFTNSHQGKGEAQCRKKVKPSAGNGETQRNAIRKESVLISIESGESNPPPQPERQVLPPVAPPATVELAALRLIEMLSLVDTPGNQKIIAAALTAEGSRLGVAPEEAARTIAEQAGEDRKHGMSIDRFYFEDTRWRNPHGSRHLSPGAQRVANNRRGFAEALRSHLAERDESATISAALSLGPQSAAGNCARHPDSGLTPWGTCYGCYFEKHGSKQAQEGAA